MVATEFVAAVSSFSHLGGRAEGGKERKKGKRGEKRGIKRRESALNLCDAAPPAVLEVLEAI